MKCTKCYYEYSDNAQHCPSCGEPNAVAQQGVQAYAPTQVDDEVATGKGYGLISMIAGILSIVYPFLSLAGLSSVGDYSYYSSYSYTAADAIGNMVWGMVLTMGIVLGILAIVFANIAKKKLPEDQRGMASAGLATGIIGVVIWPVLLIFIFAIATAMCAGLATTGWY